MEVSTYTKELAGMNLGENGKAFGSFGERAIQSLDIVTGSEPISTKPTFEGNAVSESTFNPANLPNSSNIGDFVNPGAIGGQ